MDESPFPEIAHPQQRALLTAFSKTGNVLRACEVARVGRSSHYRWLQQDPDYRKAFQVAKECAADLLEAEAWRRAVEGVERPTSANVARTAAPIAATVFIAILAESGMV